MDHAENDAARANPGSWLTKMMSAETGEAKDYYNTLINIPKTEESGQAFGLINFSYLTIKTDIEVCANR